MFLDLSMQDGTMSQVWLAGLPLLSATVFIGGAATLMPFWFPRSA